MNKFFPSVILIVIFITFWIGAPAHAQSGFYFGSEWGANFGSSLDMVGFSNDRASVCDEYINPAFDTVMGTLGYENYNCTGVNRGQGDDWQNAFDSAKGPLFGMALGYRFADNSFRFELEYFYRDTGHDQTSDIPGATGASGDKLAQEIQVATDRIGSLTSHNLFANLYFDFKNASRLTPYVGVGVGTGFTNMDYGSLWQRNLDVNAIMTGEGLDNVEQIRQTLAGSTSSAQTVLSDTLFGYQVLFGVDYALTEVLLLGVKGRWVNFHSFRNDDSIVWDPLRSHPPNLRRDGSEPVSGGLEVGDIQMFGVGLNLKYLF